MPCSEVNRVPRDRAPAFIGSSQHLRRGAWNELAVAIRTSWLSYLALFTWLTPSRYIATKIMWPIEQIIFFSLVGVYGSTQPASFFVIGNAVHSMALTAVFGVSLAVSGERSAGTLMYIFGTPTSRVTIFSARTLMYLADALTGVVIAFLFAILAYHLDFSRVNMFFLVTALAITAFSISGIGLLIGSVSLLTANVMFFNNAVYALMLLVCGVNIPLENLPSALRVVAAATPLTHGLQAIRTIFEGAPAGTVLPLLTIEAFVGTVYAGLGYVIFRWLERLALAGATLELY